MEQPTEVYLRRMLQTFGVTVEEAKQKRICVECHTCADRICTSTAAWSDGEWADWELTAFCPKCIRTEADRVNEALDANDRKDAARNWADISTFPNDWGNL